MLDESILEKKKYSIGREKEANKLELKKKEGTLATNRDSIHDLTQREKVKR